MLAAWVEQKNETLRTLVSDIISNRNIADEATVGRLGAFLDEAICCLILIVARQATV
jgi:hypothetical protein